jgi:hypothetical protein
MAVTFMLMTIVACKQKSTAVNQGVTTNPSVTVNQGVTVNPTNSNILTADDISKVTGISGVVLVPYDPHKGAGGDLNFALPDGKMLLLVTLLDAESYNQSKKLQNIYSGDVTGVGDDAFTGKVMGVESMLFFRKGSRAAGLSSFLDMEHTGKPYISQPQLRQLAALMLPRM